MERTPLAEGDRIRHAAEASAQRYHDLLAKPPGALGQLEAWAARLASLQHAEWYESSDVHATTKPRCSVKEPTLLLFAADHGSLAAHPALSAYPRAVTGAMFRTVAAGGAASSVLAASAGIRVELNDVGVDADLSDCRAGVPAAMTSVVHGKISRGTADFSIGPAMTEAELDAALAAGAAAVGRACERGATVVCLGELGLGNSTSAAALLAALEGLRATEATGVGTGINEEARLAKVRTPGVGNLNTFGTLGGSDGKDRLVLLEPTAGGSSRCRTGGQRRHHRGRRSARPAARPGRAGASGAGRRGARERRARRCGDR